jgi:vacuolar-type H+-ATPase subunit H
VITKNESDNADRVDELTKQHKKVLSEAEEKAKKLEGAKEKVERSKEEAIQNLNEKIRLVISMSGAQCYNFVNIFAAKK